MIAAALRLAGHGLAVFPVAGDGRSPLVKRGCHSATTDAEAVRAFWWVTESANLAVACGAVSGVFVLDVDRKHGVDGVATLKDLIADHGPLPKSWLSKTPGGGLHLWFAYAPGLRNRVGFAPGLDCRTDGGSVCAPPSVRRDGAYAWVRPPWACELLPAPDWLLTLIAPPPVPRPPMRPIRVDSLDRTARYVAAALDGECDAVAHAGQGGRNARLFQGAARLGELVGAGLCREDTAVDALTTAAHDCGLVHDDGPHAVAATIKSGMARGAVNPREVRP